MHNTDTLLDAVSRQHTGLSSGILLETLGKALVVVDNHKLALPGVILPARLEARLDHQQTAVKHGQHNEKDAGAGVAGGAGRRPLKAPERRVLRVEKNHGH